MLTATFCLALMMPQGPNAPVVINEFSYDDSSTDDNEFVELYNATSAAIDIGDWVLDSEDENGPNTAYTIPTGTMLAAGGYYVLGSPIVPNVDQILPPGTNLWENSQESLTLRDNNGRIVDTLVYEVNKQTWDSSALQEGEGVWGNFTSSDSLPSSWSRIRNGLDSGNNGRDFVLVPRTPGTSNNLTTVCLSYNDDFDAITAEGPIAGWGGSFVLPQAIDPTMATWATGGQNPNAIVASPQGGNAAIFWDRSGGGDACMLLGEVVGDFAYEAWVYLETTTVPDGDYETWSIGFGTTGTFHNHPDPGGVIGAGAFTANGNTGAAWVFNRVGTPTGTMSTLYLVDHNDGGWGAGAMTDATVLGSINIMPGVNDGWRRVRLERNSTQIIGTFGGMPGGGGGGQSFTGSNNWTASTTFFVGYREAMTDNSTARPPTLDDVMVTGLASAAISNFGVAAPTTSSTPTIGANGLPTLGNSGWQLNIAGLVPSSPFALWMGIPAVTPFDLQTIGGQANSFVYLDLAAPILILNLAADGTGAANPGAPIPCSTSIAGATVGWQVFGVDLALAVAVKVANTDRLDTTFGY